MLPLPEQWLCMKCSGSAIIEEKGRGAKGQGTKFKERGTWIVDRKSEPETRNQKPKGQREEEDKWQELKSL